MNKETPNVYTVNMMYMEKPATSPTSITPKSVNRKLTVIGTDVEDVIAKVKAKFEVVYFTSVTTRDDQGIDIA